MQFERAKAAVGELLTAALIGEGWEPALETLARATDAKAATLMRFRECRPLAALSSMDWIEADAALMHGLAPQTPLRFFPDHVFGEGFRVDHEVWTDDQMRTDPYYQDFLRPRGVMFHARVKLDFQPGERVSLSLKRGLELGPYEPADIRQLNLLVPELNAVARIARRVLDAEASGAVQLARKHGDPVFELDCWGRVLRNHGDFSELVGVAIRDKRLVALDRATQHRLEKAVAAATLPPQRSAAAVILDAQGNRKYLQVLPVTGRARDIFLATAAIAVILDYSTDTAMRRLKCDFIREALGLTTREAQVAQLLGVGLSLDQIARKLQLSVGTTRNHLKRIFDKAGVTRQAELVALLWNFCSG